MYLSRVEIDDSNRRKLKDLTNLAAYHGWVEKSFPDEEKSQFRHLWRIDQLKSKRYLLLVSPKKPIVKNLERYGVPGTAQIVDYDHYVNSLKEGQIMRFRLTANPVTRHGGKVIKAAMPEDKKNGETMRDRLKDWLFKRMVPNGFEITRSDFDMYNVDMVSQKTVALYHKGCKPINLKQVTYEGILKITDLDKFKAALKQGIGREKAYGMGLITVIPIN